MPGQAKVRFVGEDATAAAWRSALGRARTSANQLQGMFRAAFAGISVAGIVSVGRNAIKMGDDLNKAAIKAGITGHAMSELAYVARQSDIDLTSLSTAIKKMQVNLSEVATGAKAPTQALQALGLSLKDLQGLDADRQFEIIGDRISQLKEPADKARAATELFGKAGADLLPLFDEGAEGIKHLREEAVLLGATLDDAQIQKLADADSKLKQLQASWEGFTARFVSELAPALARAMDYWSGRVDIYQQVADQEEKLQRLLLGRNLFGSNAELDHAIAVETKKLRQLQDLAVQRSSLEMGVVKIDPNAPPPPKVPGFAAVAGADDSEDKKRVAEYQATMDDFWDAYTANATEAYETVTAAELENRRLYEEGSKETEDRLAEYRQEKEAERREEMQRTQDELTEMFTDAFMRGKEGWDDLLRYWARQLLSSGITKLVGSIFNLNPGGSGGSGSGGLGIAQGEWDWMKRAGGFLGGMFGGFGSIFGFASGGRPPLDRPSVIGEKGPELWWPDRAGTVIPNHALGGGAPVINYNINAQGATVDLIKVLPRLLQQHGESVKQDILEGIRRRRYLLST